MSDRVAPSGPEPARVRTGPEALAAAVSGVALVVLLVLLPGPVAAIHIAAGVAALSGLLALHLACSPSPIRPSAAAAHAAAGSTRLDQRIEELQDLQWEVSEREARYRDLIESQNEIILRQDMDGRLTFANRAFYRVFGLAPGSATGRPVDLQVVDGDRPPPLTLDSSPRRRTLTQVVETATGPRWIAWDQQVVTTARPGVCEVQSIGRDVTDSLRVEAELKHARDCAEAANRAKSRFLAAMSHEIRTPMNGILGMSSLLIDTVQTAEQQTYVRAIDQSARNLLALIDEILDFSKIEAGKLVLAERPFSLTACIEAAIELLAPKAYEKGLELAWTIEPTLPRWVLADEARMRQVLLNLLSNAVKFTDVGGVSVHVASTPPRAGDPAGTFGVAIAVRDTGIGLSPDDMRNLFAEFEQADAAVRRRTGGTGLGLAISKRIARAMDGDISVMSSPGNGATFTATFRVKAGPPGTCDAGGTDDAMPRLACHPGLRVLLAMDGLIERGMLTHVLEQAGVPCTAVAPRDAIAIAQSAERSGVLYDHVIVDAGRSASDAAAILLALRRVSSGPPVKGIVLVDVLSRAGLAAYREAGFDAYLVRPVRPDALLRQLGLVGGPDRRRLADPADLAAGAGGIAPRHGARPRLLLAEDNDINALLARRMIETSGCDVEWVKNGRDAVARARAAIAGEAPSIDLILMDILMPFVDGIEAAQSIKALFRGASPAGAGAPPVVALTANAFPEDRDRYFAAGMDDYLAKPFDRAALQAILHRWLSATAVQTRTDGVKAV